MSDKVKLGDAPEKGGDGEKKAKLAALLKKARAGIKKQAENSEDKQKKEESASLSTPVVGDQIVQRVQDLVEGEGINKEEKAQHGAHTENMLQGRINMNIQNSPMRLPIWNMMPSYAHMSYIFPGYINMMPLKIK